MEKRSRRKFTSVFKAKVVLEALKERRQTKEGVYKIMAVRNGQRQPVKRFFRTDNNGVHYIGKATSFFDRVIDLKKSISPDHKGSAYICGRRYKSNPNIAVKFPYDILFVELIPSETPEKYERKLITEYAYTFGEVPPPNAV